MTGWVSTHQMAQYQRGSVRKVTVHMSRSCSPKSILALYTHVESGKWCGTCGHKEMDLR